MTDTTTLAVVSPIRSATLDMARSVLMGVGSVPLVSGIATGQQWQAIVGGLLALASAVLSYIAAHPSKTGALQTTLSLVRAGGQSTAWDGDVAALETALIPRIEQLVDAQIKAKAGMFAEPVDLAANAAVKTAVDTVGGHLRIV